MLINLAETHIILPLEREDPHPRALRGSMWWSFHTSERRADGKPHSIREKGQLLHPEFGEPVGLNDLEVDQLFGYPGVVLHVDGRTCQVRLELKPKPQLIWLQDTGHLPIERQRIPRVRYATEPGVLVQSTLPRVQAFGQPEQSHPRVYGFNGVSARNLLTLRPPGKPTVNVMVVTNHCGRPVRGWLDVG